MDQFVARLKTELLSEVTKRQRVFETEDVPRQITAMQQSLQDSMTQQLVRVGRRGGRVLGALWSVARIERSEGE